VLCCNCTLFLIICICFNHCLTEGVISSHCRYSSTYKFAEPDIQDEYESREDDVKEETGIYMYKIIRQIKRLHMFQ
jgi:hypothetical protein